MLVSVAAILVAVVMIMVIAVAIAVAVVVIGVAAVVRRIADATATLELLSSKETSGQPTTRIPIPKT